jgi:hypothetical protein
MAHRALHLGRIRLDGLAPAGMPAVLMPDLVYGVEASRAGLRGVDLGEVTTAAVEPRVGGFPFPVRGVLAIGDFRARIADEQESGPSRTGTARIARPGRPDLWRCPAWRGLIAARVQMCARTARAMATAAVRAAADLK